MRVAPGLAFLPLIHPTYYLSCTIPVLVTFWWTHLAILGEPSTALPSGATAPGSLSILGRCLRHPCRCFMIFPTVSAYNHHPAVETPTMMVAA